MSKTRHRPDWRYGALIPAVYVVVELAFNYQLTNIASETVSDEILAGLEFWGRIISGVGLGLLVYRVSLPKLTIKLLPLIICILAGVIVMWSVQRELTEYLVRSANSADKSAAVALSLLAPDAAAGNLKTLKGESIVSTEVTSMEKKSMMALFPAAALHSENRDQQINSWLTQISVKHDANQSPQFTLENAYKNLIVPPIALGLSILFALLNLSLLIAFFIELFYEKHQMIMRIVIFTLLVTLSIQQSQGFINSDGYKNSLRTGLWQSAPMLALLVEWSASATPTWGEISELSSRIFLLGYSFSKPHWDFP